MAWVISSLALTDVGCARRVHMLEVIVLFYHRSQPRFPRRLRVTTLTVVLLCAFASLASAVPGNGAPERSWEGLASLDFPSLQPPLAPDIAVGPDDVLTIVNRRLSRYPNPNAVGRARSTDPLVQSTFLDTWLGQVALDELCPTTPRSAQSCVIGDASLRYDQMQGRFVVLFTVTDTGAPAGVVTNTRKASWVLGVSRFASLTPRTSPASDPLIFSDAGGTKPNPAIWTFWYGNALNGLGTDGFGNPPNAGSVGFGNINALPGIAGAASAFDCRASAIAAAGTSPTKVCYFPTSARLGLDNDAITIVSPVVNVNINPANLSATYNPPSNTPAFAGTRIRVLKKTALYQASAGDPTLTAGNEFAASEAARFLGSYYDLFTSPDGQGTPITYSPYTLVASTDAPTIGQPTTPPAPASVLAPVFFEPAHLRGRPQASYANPPTLGLGVNQTSQTYLLGATATPFGSYSGSGTLWVQRIQHVRANTAPIDPIPFYPMLGTGADSTTSDPATRRGLPEALPVGAFTDPGPLAQARDRGNATTPPLYVGDDRPQRVIFREGHLYDARAVALPNVLTFSGGALTNTVTYDIIPKLVPEQPAQNVFNPYWGNTSVWAPMFDVPANVAFAGTISPVDVLPFLEKLFVGTTYPPLAPTLRANDPRFIDDTGQRIPNLRCVNSHRPPDAGAWPSLFDLRCGADPYDTPSSVVDPATGISASKLAFSLTGGGATDPNDGSLWLYGAYARRLQGNAGAWGTYVANYDLSFPATDPYGNAQITFTDVPTSFKGRTTVLALGVQQLLNFGVVPNGTRFLPKQRVSRIEMAIDLARVLMDDFAIDDYLTATAPGPGTSSFDDLPTNAPGWRYIEAMYRRGIIPACAPNLFCPGDDVARGQMAVFIIRAKMANVFPTTLLGCAPSAPIATCGAGTDNFGLFVPTDPFYKDNENVPGNDFYPYIQMMQSLRIDGESKLGKNGVKGKFAPTKPLTRGQLTTFLVRAFFP